MKRFFCLMVAGCCAVCMSFAQQRVEWRRDKVTQIIFPTRIEKFRCGYTSDDAVSQQDGQVLYIQPIDPLPETNLYVITVDGCYYVFDLVYDDSAERVNYIVHPTMAFYRHGDDSAEPVDTALRPSGGVDISDAGSSKDAVPESGNPLFSEVLRSPGYIVTDNVVKLQRLALLLKGVYVDATHIFFRLRIENRSNVPFDVDYVAFSVEARKTRKTSTQERLQILPLAVDREVHRIDARSFCEVVYCFEKFTIGKDKLLLAEVLEQGGDRNIGLRIRDSYIIDARRL